MHFIRPEDFAGQLLIQLMSLGQGPRFKDDQVKQCLVKVIDQLRFNPTEIPEGPELEPGKIFNDYNANKNIEATGDLFDQLQEGATAIIFVGEDHGDPEDKIRAVKFMKRIQQDELYPNLLLLERKLYDEYKPSNIDVAQESTLCPVMGLDRKQRSMVAAAFLAVCNGSGNQLDTSKNIIFFGENHEDILGFYEELIGLSMVSYLRKKPRYYLILRSSVQ